MPKKKKKINKSKKEKLKDKKENEKEEIEESDLVKEIIEEERQDSKPIPDIQEKINSEKLQQFLNQTTKTSSPVLSQVAIAPEKNLERDIENIPIQREENINENPAYTTIGKNYNSAERNYDTSDKNNNNKNYQSIETNVMRPKTFEDNRDNSGIREAYVEQERNTGQNMQPERIRENARLPFEENRKKLKKAEFQEYKSR